MDELRSEHAALKVELKQWKASFLAWHGRKPDRKDVPADQLTKLTRLEQLETQLRNCDKADDTQKSLVARAPWQQTVKSATPRTACPEQSIRARAMLSALRQQVQGSQRKTIKNAATTVGTVDRLSDGVLHGLDTTVKADVTLPPSLTTQQADGAAHRMVGSCVCSVSAAAPAKASQETHTRVGVGGLSASKAFGCNWNADQVRHRLNELARTHVRVGPAIQEEGDSNVETADAEANLASTGQCAPCSAETGCLCLEPGLRCGFAWRKASEYEEQRDASRRENEATLRALGLLPERPDATLAHLAGTVSNSSDDDCGESCTDNEVAVTNVDESKGAHKLGAEAAQLSVLQRNCWSTRIDCGSKANGRGRGNGMRRVHPGAAANDNFVKTNTRNRSYAGRGGCRGKVGTQSGAKRARAERQSKMDKRLKGSRVGDPDLGMVQPLNLHSVVTTGTSDAPAHPAQALRYDVETDCDVFTSGHGSWDHGDSAPAHGRKVHDGHSEIPQAIPPIAVAASWENLSKDHRALLSQASSMPAATAGGHAKKRQLPPVGHDDGERELGSAHPHDNLNHLLQATLNQVFGLSSFKEGQVEAMRRIMAAQSTLLVLPTGGGKSLAYQLPAFLSTQITLVVSPLLSLMADQLAALPSSLAGVAISSEQLPFERRMAMDALRHRDASGAASTRLLFIAPERLADAGFQDALRSLPPVSGCRCLAFKTPLPPQDTSSAVCYQCGASQLPALGFACIDEAHCLSEWSHNFRPSYMAVGHTLRSLGVKTILGLTATATARTAASICANLALSMDATLRYDIHRANLTLSAELIEEPQRMLRVLSLLRQLPRGAAAIIYCNSRWEVDQTSRDLQSRGWSCDGYHAGRLQTERQHVQNEFMNGKLQIVVATVAFGMGVHKANVRLVVHAGLPRSIEAWVQETGRAGRDGLPARCIALVCEADYRRLHSQCHRDGVDFEQLQQLLTQLMQNARNGYGELPHKQLESKLDMTREVAQTALALLAELPLSAWQSEGGDIQKRSDDDNLADSDVHAQQHCTIELQTRDDLSNQNTCTLHCTEVPARLKHQCQAGQQAAGLVELLPEIRRTAVLSFHHSTPETVAAHSPLIAMLLKYAKETNGSYKCQLVQSASELGLDVHRAHGELASLHARGVVRVEFCDGSFYVRLGRVPTPAEARALSAELMRRMQHVEQLQRTKLDASAALMWLLAAATHHQGLVRTQLADGTADVGPCAVSPTQSLLARYFADGRLDEKGWEAPFLGRTLPVSLRGDVLDFVATHTSAVGKAGAPLTGRAVARIFHKLPSPSFPKKDWERNRFWGMHCGVDFDVLRRIADEHIETVRRHAKKQPKRKRKAVI